MRTANPVLVVEDDQTLRESMVEYLDDHGHPAISAVNGQDALDQLERLRDLPCLILLDLMMPVMDGVTFRREQRRRARLADIPVIVVSAFNDIATRSSELDGAVCLKKPVKLADVLRVVETHCEMNRPSINRTILLVEDHEDTAEMLAALLQMEGFDVVVAHSASDAVVQASTARPFLVLMDFQLPDGSGAALCKSLRRVVPEARIVAVTGYPLPRIQGELAEAGFHDAVQKPVAVGLFRKLIREAGAITAGQIKPITK